MTVLLEHAEEIAGHEYRMTKFSYEEGVRLGARVLQLLGSAASFTGVGAIMHGFGAGLLAQGDAKFIGELLRRTIRDGVKLDKPEALEAAYRGNYGELLLALEWVCRENFSSFFGEGVRQLVERLLNSLPTNASSLASWSLPTATGTSTQSPPPSGSP